MFYNEKDHSHVESIQDSCQSSHEGMGQEISDFLIFKEIEYK